MVAEYWPDGQLVQLVADTPEYWPATQLEQVMEAACEENVPAEQGEHVADPVAEYWPAEQTEHTAVCRDVDDEQAEPVHVRAPQQAYWLTLQLLQVPLRSAG